MYSLSITGKVIDFLVLVANVAKVAARSNLLWSDSSLYIDK
jgi:hypothetical protein